MTNHPNRSQRGELANPLPAEIISARQAAGLTQTEAALEIMGKLHVLLESISESTDTPPLPKTH